MIFVSRGQEPKALERERERQLAKLNRAWNSAGVDAEDADAVADFVGQYGAALDQGYGQARELLQRRWKRKCAYCGHETSKSEPLDHFRPRRPLKHKQGYEHTGYWWLTWSWNNLLPSCTTCNLAKGNAFPIAGERMRPWAVDRNDEQAMLIDPSAEDPRGKLQCVREVTNGAERWTVQGKGRRGKQTVRVLGLDEDDERYNSHLEVLAQFIESLESALEQGREQLLALWQRKIGLYTDGTLPFPLLSHAYIDHHFGEQIREHGLAHPYPGDGVTPPQPGPLFPARPELDGLDEDLVLDIRGLGRRPPRERTHAVLRRLVATRSWTLAELAELLQLSPASLKRHLRELAAAGELGFDGVTASSV